MRVFNLRLAAVALAGGLTLGGCAYGYDPYGGGYGGLGVGVGYNSGYGNYGYGYGDPYGGYGYGGYPYGGYGNYVGYGYGGYPYGWYNDFYYPGSGYYVYDRHHHRRQITDAERQYWRDKFSRYHSTSGTTVTTSSMAPRENWTGFNRVRTRSLDTTNSGTTDRSNRGSWRRPSTTTTSNSDTTSSQPNHGWHHRDRSNPQ